jgi:L-lactate dehydrogenase complex protein LldG
MTAGSRQAILDRVRAATRAEESRYDEIPREYIRQDSLDTLSQIHLMTQRLEEYGAGVAECEPADLNQTIARELQQSGGRLFVAPPALPNAWLWRGVKWRADEDLSYPEIEECDGIVTAASAGVAESGTIVLHHGPMEGRRVISLLPDFHLCVLFASQIVETLPEYFARLTEPPRLATYISGPSATADIEMTRIKGVHGPRYLNAILVRDDL